MTERPTLYLFAGPNGAGKTTYARNYLRAEARCLHFLNADYLAQGLSPLAPELAALEAGKLLIRKMTECMDKKDSFALESTLSGATLASRLQIARQAGYKLRLFYFWLPDVEISKARVRMRVLKGGHHVADTDIERRFSRSVMNLRRHYLRLADDWNLFDGAASPARLVASGDLHREDVFDEFVYASILSA